MTRYSVGLLCSIDTLQQQSYLLWPRQGVKDWRPRRNLMQGIAGSGGLHAKCQIRTCSSLFYAPNSPTFNGIRKYSASSSWAFVIYRALNLPLLSSRYICNYQPSISTMRQHPSSPCSSARAELLLLLPCPFRSRNKGQNAIIPSTDFPHI